MIKLEAQLMTPSASSGGKIEKTLQKDAGINTLSPGCLGKGAKFMQLGFCLSEVQLFFFLNRFSLIEQF